ncbi:MAG: hypothetical protein KJ069_14615 [Anaerolineae bacterium]|nr:hypothetical protein [Anaerolineae bacterium]
MSQTISISHQTYDQLRQRAAQSRMSPDTLAENVLSDYLSQEEVVWQEAFTALLAKVHQHTTQFSSAEIEDDITQALREVRAARYGY